MFLPTLLFGSGGGALVGIWMATLRQPTGVRVLVAGVKGVERAAGKVASVGQILLREIWWRHHIIKNNIIIKNILSSSSSCSSSYYYYYYYARIIKYNKIKNKTINNI